MSNTFKIELGLIDEQGEESIDLKAFLQIRFEQFRDFRAVVVAPNEIQYSNPTLVATLTVTRRNNQNVVYPLSDFTLSECGFPTDYTVKMKAQNQSGGFIEFQLNGNPSDFNGSFEQNFRKLFSETPAAIVDGDFNDIHRYHFQSYTPKNKSYATPRHGLGNVAIA